MKIPTGNFGFVTPGPPQPADTRSLGTGVENLGAGLSELAQQQQRLARAKAVNSSLDDQIATQAQVNATHDRLASGELDYTNAGATFRSELDKVPMPDMSGLDRATATALSGGIRAKRAEAALRVDELASSYRVDAGAQQATDSFGKIATLSTIPTTDPLDLLNKANAAATLARANGVPQEKVTADLDVLRTHIASSVVMRNPATALTKLANPASGDPVFDNLTFDARTRVTEHAKAALVQQVADSVTKIYATQGPDAGANVLAKLDNSSMPDHLLDEVRGRVQQAVSSLRTQRREQNVLSISRLEQNIALGVAGRAEHDQVDTLWAANALTPTETAGYHAAIDKASVENAKRQDAAHMFDEAMAGGLPLDPSNPEHRKVLDAAFERDTLGTTASLPWQSIAIAYAGRTRMLPSAATSWARSAMRSPDASLAASAAQFYGSVDAAAPDAASSFDSDTRAFAATVNSMVESGTPAPQAVATARANVFEISEDQRKRRTHAWSGAGNAALNIGQPAALNTYIGRDFDAGWFHSNPAAVDPKVARAAGAKLLQNDFDQQTERYFTKTGDIAVARDLAWKDVSRVYGPTRVNGTLIMAAFPVERFGVKPEEVRAEVAAFIAENPQADGTTAEDAVLVPDSLTLRDVGDALSGETIRPSYALVGKTGDLVLDRNGVPVRWTIPSGEELGRRFREAQAASAAMLQKQLDAAREERAQREQQRRAFAESVRAGNASPNQD